MSHDILLLDNNAVRKLADGSRRRVLRANLRATGREFWPSAVNVLEATKSREPRTRSLLLGVLGELAGDNHVLTLPTEAIKILATALSCGNANVDLSEPRLTRIIREPESLTEEFAADAREHLVEQESSFRGVHEKGQRELRPVLAAKGGADRWPTVNDFLDQVWTVPSHLESYADRFWEDWGLPDGDSKTQLLEHPAWKLFFDGWGAAAYTKSVAHPQPRWVETADLQQLVYMGFARSALMLSDDGGLRHVGNQILQGRGLRAEVLPVVSMTE